MEKMPEWIASMCAVGSLIVSIIALVKANGASNKVNSLFAQNATNLRMGSQKVKGDNNKTATGSGNTIS